MDPNIVECESKAPCPCKTGATLDILKDVQRAYEARLQLIERVGGKDKMQMLVHALRSWVSDLVAQNTLLVRAVEELEQEAIARVKAERRRHAERNATTGGVETDNRTLQLSLLAKDREIKRLNKDLQQCEQTMARMRDEMNTDVLKKDAEVMAGMCCTGTECGDLVPVKDIGELLREETSKYRERLQNMETSLKSSSVKLRTVHKVNLGLIEELNSLRRFCVAVDMERRDLRLKLDLEGQIVKQMVRQLRQAKAKLQHKEIEHPAADYVSGDNYGHPNSDSLPVPCSHVRVATSTPDGTQVLPEEAEISIIPVQISVTISDEDFDDASIFELCKCCANYECVHNQTTLKLDTPDRTQNLVNQSRNLITESSSRKESQKRWIDSGCSSLNQNKTVETEFSSRNQNETITSQSVRNQDTNLVTEYSPRDLTDNQTPVSGQRPFCLSRYVTPIATSREPSENLQLGSSQSARNQSTNLDHEHNSRDRIDSQKASDQSQSRYNLSEERYGKRSKSQPDLNQSARNQNTNLFYEHNSRDSKDNLNHSRNNVTEETLRKRREREHIIPEAIPREREQIIPEAIPRERSVSLQPGSDQSDNNQSKGISGHSSKDQINDRKTAPNERYPSRFPMHKASPRDVVIKSDRDRSQKSKNITLDSLSEHTKAGTQSGNPSEQKKSSLEPDQSQPPSNGHNDEELIKRSEINDGMASEECLCKCLCEHTSHDSQNNHLPNETTSKSENDNEKTDEECQCKCLCQYSSYDPITISDTQKCVTSEHLSKEASSSSENDKEKTSYKSENVKEKEADECQCKCICQYSSYDSRTISDPQKCITSEHLPKETSSKSENVKEKKADECQCKCTCGETQKNNNSTVSVNQRWMITPEGIMKGLEALKRSFLGQSEDHTSIWINNSHETCHHKKTVTIQEPIRSDKCVYCDPTGSCEEDSDGCVSPKRDRETRKHDKSDGSQGTETVFIVENAGPKIRSGSNREPTEDDEGTSETAAVPRRMLRAKPVLKDAAQDSGGGSSCVGAREQYYRDKLLATLQILENKEETIRVQASSLSVAEDRISELTKRAGELRQELEHKARELNQIQQFEDRRVDKSDVSISAEAKEAEAQKHLVETLEDNLTTVMELYRECFYETAKQEELIDMLRKSYLDVRLMEKDKTDRINRLQNVINTQKRSIEQCQDVVLGVESLKSEISSFLNSSNNDSGMWERGSESPDVGEELADILDQLRQLQQMLTSDCTCGLQEECTSLKERNKVLEVELENQKQRSNELDGALRQILDQQYEEQLKEKEREFQEVVKKMAEVENACEERSGTCETLRRRLQQAEVMLDNKMAELVEAQQSREAQDSTVRRLQLDLDKADRLVEEGLKKLSEVTHSRTELLLESQARITELEQRLRNATRRCRDLEAGCREREVCLEEAHTRGARLCDESRRVTAFVKQWMRDKKQLARELQEKVKMQKLRICELERCVGARRNFCELTSQSETDPGCSNSTQEHRLSCETSHPRCPRLNPACRSETTTLPRGPIAESIERERENETASCSRCASNRQESASEMASCSQAPVPPRRQIRQSGDDINNRHTSQPSRFEPSNHPDIRWSRLYSRLRQASPTDEVLERVEHLHAALAAGQRRWGRHRR